MEEGFDIPLKIILLDTRNSCNISRSFGMDSEIPLGNRSTIFDPP